MNEQAIKELAAKNHREIYERLPAEALREKLIPYYREKEFPAANMFRNDKEYRKALIKEILHCEFGF